MALLNEKFIWIDKEYKMNYFNLKTKETGPILEKYKFETSRYDYV